ncbi:unnamed protein product, partial [Brassica oleracea]
FHGFSCGSTTVSVTSMDSSEMLQGIGKEGVHTRLCGLGTSGSGGESLLRMVVLNRWVSKVHMFSDVPLHLGSSPLFCLLFHSTERLYSLNPCLPYRLLDLASSQYRYGSGVNGESVSRTGLASLL